MRPHKHYSKEKNTQHNSKGLEWELLQMQRAGAIAKSKGIPQRNRITMKRCKHQYKEDTVGKDRPKRNPILFFNYHIPSFLKDDEYLNFKTTWKQQIIDENTSIMKSIKKGSCIINFFRELKKRSINEKLPQQDIDPEILQSMNKMWSIGEIKGHREPYKKRIVGKAKDNEVDQLPIRNPEIIKEFLKLIRDEIVIIVHSATGSGKSTQIPQILYEHGYGRKGIIGCTQPRRIATISVSRRVSDEMSSRIGGLVGYAVRFDEQISSETKIKYVTDGILLREFLSDPYLSRYSVIIIDEAHERSLQNDIIMFLVRRLITYRHDVRVVIMSATLENAKFLTYFGNTEILKVPGRMYPITVKYMSNLPSDYLETTIRYIIMIHKYEKPGDILVFLTGREDIELACKLLHNHPYLSHGESSPLGIYPLYANLPDADEEIFNRDLSVRSCIISTNVAETSLTIDNISYVIDSGLAKLMVYNPLSGVDVLRLYPISKENADQRAGRGGRTSSGTCYRLYPEFVYRDEMPRSTIPEIQRTNITTTILLLKSMNIDLKSFKFIDPPAQSSISSGLFHLWLYKALDDEGSLTKHGKMLSILPLDLPLAHMIILGSRYSCAYEIIRIAGMLSIPNGVNTQESLRILLEHPDRSIVVEDSDHLTCLNIYIGWEKAGFSETYTKRYHLSYGSLLRVRSVVDQLYDILKKNGLSINRGRHIGDKILRKVIGLSYVKNIARSVGIGSYVGVMANTKSYLHPQSILSHSPNPPSYVAYHELIYTNKEYICYGTGVDPAWIAEEYPECFRLQGCER